MSWSFSRSHLMLLVSASNLGRSKCYAATVANGNDFVVSCPVHQLFHDQDI